MRANFIGGSLSSNTSFILFGSKYLPTFRNSILFLEEVNEPPYKIDRMINQLRLSNILNYINGVVLGRFVNCYETDKTKNMHFH
ncbi:MAG: hypothetical protein U5K00_14170 [Melioribacteraceae bacterium]|nr:hypothetical protein [Melioribacteraceae bacterium]